MKPLGKPKLTKTKVAGHQNCAVCHPDTKGGRTREKRMSKQEIESQEHICSQVIPDTFIMCGEGGNYCSPECMRRANESK